MSRTLTKKAIVLKSQRFAEIHKRLTMLTADSGVIDATAYGALRGKSKLSGTTDLFSLFVAYLYYEPVKKNYKLTDLEPISSFDGIRSDVKRFFIASLWAEVVQKTYAGGDEHGKLFPLLAASLTNLDSAGNAVADLLNVQFLYRFLHIIGYPPFSRECARCGKPLRADEETRISLGGTVTCPGCATPDSSAVSVGAKRYLQYTTELAVSDAGGVTLDGVSLSGVKESLYRVLREVVETRLLSLETGGALL